MLQTWIKCRVYQRSSVARSLNSRATRANPYRLSRHRHLSSCTDRSSPTGHTIRKPKSPDKIIPKRHPSAKKMCRLLTRISQITNRITKIDKDKLKRKERRRQIKLLNSPDQHWMGLILMRDGNYWHNSTQRTIMSKYKITWTVIE